MNETDNDTKKLLELAVAVSGRVDLSEINLISCNCNLLTFPTETDNRCEVTGYANANVDVDQKKIFVIAHFNLHTANNNGKELARIEADFLLVYRAKSLEGLDESNYDAFASCNGIYNVWPYWREFVNNMTSRLKLPPLTLHVYQYGAELPTESTLLAEIQEKTQKKEASAKKKLTKKKAATKKKVSTKKKTAKKAASKKTVKK